MFPQKVYHCPCVAFEVKLCLVDGIYSLRDIISKLNEKLNLKYKIYSSKCRNNEVVFSCRQHMDFVTNCEIDNKTCLRCIKTFLQTAYYWSYEYTNFDLPLLVKQEKKVLCLLVEKLQLPLADKTFS